MVELHDRGVAELVLVIGKEKVADKSNAVFVEPREVVENCMKSHRAWLSMLRFENRALPGRPETNTIQWSSCNKWANSVLKSITKEYMEKADYYRETHPNTRQTLTGWVGGKWKLPTIKFLQVTARTELGKLNAPF